MFVIARHETILQKLGLASLEQVRAFTGELIKNHRGRRDILRIQTADSAGRPLVLFLKRNLRPYKKDGLSSLLARRRVWSLSRQEWENSRILQSAGLATAALVAFGEECGPLWERFSFLLTEAAEGGQTLAEFLRKCRDQCQRRRVLDALAGEVSRMHAAGLATPDLFTRHIFVNAATEPPRFCLIDMARLDSGRALTVRRRARDLAALNATAQLRFVSSRERVRFLRLYAGRFDRPLFRAIARRMRHLLRRGKYRDFFRTAPASS